MRSKLENAPIVEALVDFRFAAACDLKDVTAFADGLAADYPSNSDIWHHESVLGFGPGGSDTSTSRRMVGRKLGSVDGAYVLQVTRDGMTLSRLEPYQSWESLRDEVKRIWSGFSKACGRVSLKRLALRTINRLPVPVDAGDVDDWLAFGPKIPKTLPQALHECHTRLVMPMPSTSSTAIITCRWSAAEARDQVLPVMLDIDLFHLRGDGDEVDSEEAWRVLEELHEQRNTIFFDSITPQMKEALE